MKYPKVNNVQSPERVSTPPKNLQLNIEPTYLNRYVQNKIHINIKQKTIVVKYHDKTLS